MSLFFAGMPEPAPEMGAAPTAPVREHLARLRAALTSAETLVRTLTDYTGDAQLRHGLALRDFLEEGLRGHLQADAAVLYPLVEQYRAGDLPLTRAFSERAGAIMQAIDAFQAAVMRLPEMVREAQAAGQQALVEMHQYVDEVDAVLLPVLDQALTPRQAQRLLVQPLLDHAYGTGPVDHHASQHHMRKYHGHDG